jgi:hypothetical protein
MNEPATLQTIARQIERILFQIDAIEGQMTVLKGMLMRTDAHVRGFVAEMREWRQSRADDDEPQRER